MVTQSLAQFYDRDMKKLRLEIDSYQKEQHLWIIDKGILNSGGNLCLHLIGNLQTYLGVGLLGTNYIRDRDQEFSTKNIPKHTLLQKIDDTMQVVHEALLQVDDQSMNDVFPMVIWEAPKNMAYTLIHLHSHLNYHLGQINYHRRLLDF